MSGPSPTWIATRDPWRRPFDTTFPIAWRSRVGSAYACGAPKTVTVTLSFSAREDTTLPTSTGSRRSENSSGSETSRSMSRPAATTSSSSRGRADAERAAVAAASAASAATGLRSSCATSSNRVGALTPNVPRSSPSLAQRRSEASCRRPRGTPRPAERRRPRRRCRVRRVRFAAASAGRSSARTAGRAPRRAPRRPVRASRPATPSVSRPPRSCHRLVAARPRDSTGRRPGRCRSRTRDPRARP